MAKASPQLSSFNAGELSPLLGARQDIGKYANGCSVLDNYIPTIQGPLLRRGGTRFVGEVKDSTNRTWLVRFEYSTSQSFQIEFGDYYLRFYTQRGQVLVSGVAAYNGGTTYAVGDLVSSGGVNYYCIASTTGNAPPNATYWYALTGSIYEIPTPYPVAALTNTDGTFALSVVQSADVMYIANRGYPLQKLSRYGTTKWILAAPQLMGGPFNKPDGTTTVYSSANTGNVTLTASAALWQAGHVGSLFYLAEKDVRSIVQWEPGKAYALNALVRYNGVNYWALNAATSGSIPPTHKSGAVYDGTTGVQWQYLDPGFGYALITGFTSSTVVSATVLRRIPDNAVAAGNATKYYGQGVFNGVDGYPALCSFFHERLVLARDDKLELSVSGDYENFSAKDGSGNVVADQAINLTLVSRKRNNLLWLEPSSDMMMGTSGGEFVCRELTRNSVFGAGNCTILQKAEYGSAGIKPTRVGFSTIFVQRAANKVRDIEYDTSVDVFKSADTTVLSEHLTRGGLVTSAYQQDPYSIVWYGRTDGKLLGLTYNKEQDVVGWHPHTIGGGGIVESLSSIPSPDGTRTDLWMIVRRTINGSTKRYVEYMEAEHRAGDDPDLSFYVDAGLTYDGAVNATLTPGSGATVAHTVGVTFTAGSSVWVAGDVGREIHYTYTYTDYDEGGNPITLYKKGKAVISAYTSGTQVTCTINAAFPSTSIIDANGWRMTATTLSGLSHLEGQTVDVLINGATHPQRTVTGGSITLQSAASVVQVGLPCPARMRTMRLNAGAQDGTSQGKTARINKCTIRLYETLGLQFGHNFTAMDDEPFRTALNSMDNAVPLFTGDIVLDWPGEYDTHPWLCFGNNQPLPSCIIGIMPQVHTQDRN